MHRSLQRISFVQFKNPNTPNNFLVFCCVRILLLLLLLEFLLVISSVDYSIYGFLQRIPPGINAESFYRNSWGFFQKIYLRISSDFFMDFSLGFIQKLQSNPLFPKFLNGLFQELNQMFLWKFLLRINSGILSKYISPATPALVSRTPKINSMRISTRNSWGVPRNKFWKIPIRNTREGTSGGILKRTPVRFLEKTGGRFSK